jgi:cyclopropane-fatty-acyl-phospholipid synthase
MATLQIAAPPPLDHWFQPPRAPQAYDVVTPGGGRKHVGLGRTEFTVCVNDDETWARLLEEGTYRTATAFVRGEFDVEGDFLAAVRWWHARGEGEPRPWRTLLAQLSPETRFQTRSRARRNIGFHYDRSNRFYQQFLDRRMVYSSAYFSAPGMSLDDAQAAKLDLIAHKLELEKGDRFLDVGCGWGALAIRAAECYGASAVGCTLSSQQFAYATNLVQTRRLDSRVAIENADYRTLGGAFDKVASIGMYEHVGRRRLESYFATLSALIRPGGLLLNSGVTRRVGMRDDAETVFLRRFVFPGGELPFLPDVVRAAERAGLEVRGVENLRLHYGLTCGAWVTRLQARRSACLELVDAETYRTWLLYLAGAATSFERGEIDLHHVLLRKAA